MLTYIELWNSVRHAFLGPLGTLARMMEATLKFVVCDFELEFQFKPKNTI